MMAVALLGLRSGSKGIKDKNIKLLFGKPLFYWILNTIFGSNLFSAVIVSSDSQYYLDLVRNFFPQASLRLRPASLASDLSLEYDFVVDAIEWADRSGLIPEGESIFCRFHATSPFQSYEDMYASIDSLSANPMADSSVLLRPSPVNPEKTILINDDHQLFPVAIGFDGRDCASVTPKNRQQLRNYFIRSNIICFRHRVLALGSLTGNICVPVITCSNLHVDIDTELDFAFAEFLMQKHSSPP